MSRSPRSVWVEMLKQTHCQKAYTSRSPRSVWVEIKNSISGGFSAWVTLPTERESWNIYCLMWTVHLKCHAPHGACELKYQAEKSAWYIVICHAPHGACELKLSIVFIQIFLNLSRSPRSVWVEIFQSVFFCYFFDVTLPTERVSWNDVKRKKL